MAIPERLKALREALKLSQEEVAAGSGGLVSQSNYSKLERGENKARTEEAREGIARGLGLSLLDFKDYVAGRMTLQQAVAAAQPPGKKKPSEPPPANTGARPAASGGVGAQPLALQIDEPSRTPSRAEVLEQALFRAMDADQFIPGDFDAVRRTIQETYFSLGEGALADPTEFIRDVLVAAKQLRIEGHRVTSATIMGRVATGKTRHAQAVGEERVQRKIAEADAGLRERGLSPGSPERLNEELKKRANPKFPKRMPRDD